MFLMCLLHVGHTCWPKGISTVASSLKLICWPNQLHHAAVAITVLMYAINLTQLPVAHAMYAVKGVQ